MIEPESDERTLKREREKEYEFLEKISRLIIEYRTEINCGAMLGILETVKLRLFHEGVKLVDKEMKKDSTDWMDAL